MSPNGFLSRAGHEQNREVPPSDYGVGSSYALEVLVFGSFCRVFFFVFSIGLKRL